MGVGKKVRGGSECRLGVTVVAELCRGCCGYLHVLHCAGRRHGKEAHEERRRAGVLAATEALLRDSPAGLDAKRTWSLMRIVIVGGGLPVRSFFVRQGCSILYDLGGFFKSV